MTSRIVIFVHGWSVTHTETYGELPERLVAEARHDAALALDVRHLYLGRYISFHDEVRVADISRAFEEALRRELAPELARGRRFIAITHSTGGPVVRHWWDHYYVQRGRPGMCPMSHLIMLAPANFGSALAALGKGRVGRLKSWVGGTEPGVAVLDWLELGSPEAWELNTRWLGYANAIGREDRVFPFVLTGQSIDRAFYDHLNSYTGETGSDGVVRVAAANLNTSYVRLVQDTPAIGRPGPRPTLEMSNLRRMEDSRSPEVPLAILPGLSHSGKSMGILRSIRNNGKPHPAASAIIQCLKVEDAASYRALRHAFEAATSKVVAAEIHERESVRLLPDREYFHDPHSMVIARVMDDAGQRIPEFDLVLTAGAEDSPDQLPHGFLADRQRNRRHPGTLTFYFNHSVMAGFPAVKDEQGRQRRPPLPGAHGLGFQLRPVEMGPFVHHAPARLKATMERLRLFIRPHETTMLDIVLRRIVRRGTFELDTHHTHRSFKDQPPGEPVATDP